MSHPKNKLDRKKENAITAKHGDTLGLHEYQGSTWIILTDAGGDTVLRVYEVTDAQLASLHAEIGRKLGLAPEATIEHVRQLHRHLGEIVSRVDAEEARRQEEAMSRMWGGPHKEKRDGQ